MPPRVTNAGNTLNLKDDTHFLDSNYLIDVNIPDNIRHIKLRRIFEFHRILSNFVKIL